MKVQTDLGKKLDIIVKLKSSKSRRSISTIAKVLKTTVGNILEREKIKCYMSLSDCPALAKKCIASSGKVSSKN